MQNLIFQKYIFPLLKLGIVSILLSATYFLSKNIKSLKYPWFYCVFFFFCFVLFCFNLAHVLNVFQ